LRDKSAIRTARCYHGRRACTIEKMRESALVVCVALVGCAPRAPLVVEREACRAGPVTLWLDFEGAGVAHATVDDSAAMPVQSVLAPSSALVPPFSSAAIAPKVTRAQAIAAVVDRVRTLVHPFNVDIVVARPPAAPYTRVLVGGDTSLLGVAVSEAGLARVDCANVTDADVVYDFAAAQTPDYGGVVGIANTAAHEAGHAFGLEHLDARHDVMYAVAAPAQTLPDLFTLAFGSGNFSAFGAARQCTSVDPVDEVALLDCNVGARPPGGDVTPPTLDWTAPAGDVPSSFTLTATASDDVAVVRVEFYKNLELVAAPSAPPYRATIEAAAGERFYVTVEAIDAAANRTSVTRALVAAPPMSSSGDGGAPADAATSLPPPTGKSSGCTIVADGAGHAAPSPWLLLAALGLAARAWRRWSASGSASMRHR
jgi:Big-like domain-containing protein